MRLIDSEALQRDIDKYHVDSSGKFKHWAQIQPTVDAVPDLLLDNGVRFASVARPGTTVYTTNGVRVYEATVRKVMYDCGDFGFDENALGTSVFLCREAAEAAAERWREAHNATL